MDEKQTPQEEGKPFSILEKFRQLKKEKEQALPTAEQQTKVEETPGTTAFQASGSSAASPNGDLGRGGFRGRKFGGFGGRGGKRNCGDDSIERPPKRVAKELWQGQSEADVGITEFVRSGPGFPVIIKHRYTDFHVHEIDLDGNVVKLTTTEIPKDKGNEEEEKSNEENPEILSPEQWAELNEIVAKKFTVTVKKDVTDLSKEDRQKIHKAIKVRFGVHVYSNTSLVDGRKIMEIGYGVKNQEKLRWPDSRPEYLHFVLHKEHCETTEAIGVISRYIKIKANKFSYAGTKDKRAVTTQQMCLRRTPVERFNGYCKWRGVTVGNFCYKWNNLRLGDLSGNLFKIVLRNVKSSEEVIAEAVESLKKNGFINYFGMQRFGQSALVPTYLIGKAILKGDWKLATELILKPREGESTYYDIKEAREVWWKTRDAAQALNCLSRKEKSIEGKILSALKKLGRNAYQNAFDCLPRNIVTLYLHSYQSLLWNKVVSRRVKQFGLKVLPGDLVKISGPKDLDRVAYRLENTKDNDSSEEDDDEEGDGCKVQVRALSAEEAETASIYDVVYPLPGDDIRFPQNEIAGWYTELLEADGYTLDAFGRVNRKYCMYGTYRKMLETVDNLNWHIQHYSDPDEDLLLSDIEILNGKPEPVQDPDGPYRAIIVEFSLKTCCYASMAIRELAKCETSTSNQAKLTNNAREEDLQLKKQRSEELEKEKVEKADECEKMDEDDDGNCDLLSNNEAQEGKLSTKKEETKDVTMEVEESPVKEVNKSSATGVEVDSVDDMNGESTQDTSDNKATNQPSNIPDGQISNTNLNITDNIHIDKEHQSDQQIDS